MPINKTILIAIYAAIGLYVLYKLLLRKDKFEEDYDKLYNDILTSDKYKVKGQYDDRS
ncbi:hypothetical protein HYX09_00045 [Candidatus Woesearchaeota archaeon]|nr:hypothetical protein [Candidatus Woesearchaeota archaeon]MBI2660639.1 hypothetical protein [Candidatus Woesearchaeota archaeon]